MLDINALRSDLRTLPRPWRSAAPSSTPRASNRSRPSASASRRGPRSCRRRRNALSKQIGMAKGKGEDARALLRDVAGIGDELEGARARARRRCRPGCSDFLLDISRTCRTSRPRRSAVRGGQRRESGAGARRARSTFPSAGPRRPRRGARACSISRPRRSCPARASPCCAAIWRACIARSRSSCSTCTPQEHGYTECYTPYIVNARVAGRHGQLPKFEADMFRVMRGDAAGDDEAASQYLISDVRDTADQFGARRDPAARSAAAQARPRTRRASARRRAATARTRAA